LPHFSSRWLIWDYFRLTLGGTIAGLVVGHLTFAIPFVVRSILAGAYPF
jgi:ABC-type spermidine/putrescine transport system permease subunit II